MGNKFLISILLISPLLAYGYFLLHKELHLLPRSFRDEWFLTREQKGFERENEFDFATEGEVDGSLISAMKSSQLRVGEYKPHVFLSFLGVEVLLILTRASLISIGSLLLTFASYLWWDGTQMHRQRTEYKQNIEIELPTIAEVFSVLISAGVSPSTAFEWIGHRATGDLSNQIREIVTRCKNGELLVSALDKTSKEIDSPLVRRFVDSIAISLERGSSLAEQLRLYVGEMRVIEQRKLLERAGKAEIGLMIPVVFLILPISVVFALWPSYQSLNGFLLH